MHLLDCSMLFHIKSVSTAPTTICMHRAANERHISWPWQDSGVPSSQNISSSSLLVNPSCVSSICLMPAHEVSGYIKTIQQQNFSSRNRAEQHSAKYQGTLACTLWRQVDFLCFIQHNISACRPNKRMHYYWRWVTCSPDCSTRVGQQRRVRATG